MNPYLKKTALAVAIASCIALIVGKNRSGVANVNNESLQTGTAAVEKNPVTTVTETGKTKKKPEPEPEQYPTDNTTPVAGSFFPKQEDPVITEYAPADQVNKADDDQQAQIEPEEQPAVLKLSVGEKTFSLPLESIPESFRDIAAQQTTIADIYYGGRSLGSMQITYTYDTIHISDPDSLIDQIADIKEPNQVKAALSGSIPSNPAHICSGAGDGNCGRLTPEIAGVIYDPEKFRADLFISRDYLVTRTPEQQKYLPGSDSSLGMIHGLTATASGIQGTDNDGNSYSLFGNSVLGWKESHLVSAWDYTKDNQFAIDTLFLERDAKGMLYGAGYLDSSSVMTPEFSAGRKVLGARIGTSGNSRTDLSNISATPIQIFTSGRSRVEVYRDNRLIYATSVEAGSRQLDTSSFPNGSYNVDIRIYEGSVLTQELSHFFVKSVRIPPSDEFLWYFEGGEMMSRTSSELLPESMSEWLVRGALSTRLTDHSALTFVGSSTSAERTIEAGLFYQGNNWELSGTGMAGNNNVAGAAVEAYTLIGGLTGNYYYRRLWNDDYNTTRETPELLGQSFTTHVLSLGTMLFNGNLNYSFSSNRDQDSSRTSTNSLSWHKNVRNFGSHTLSMQLNYSQSTNNKLGMVTLTLRRSGSNWNYNISGQSRREENETASGTVDSGDVCQCPLV